MSRKTQAIVGLIFNTIIVLTISKLAQGTFNPFEVFKGESTFLKILVGFFLLLMVFGLLSLLIQPKDQNCASGAEGCGGGKSVYQFNAEYGMPVRCPFCKRYYHYKCFHAGGGSLLKGCKREDCPSAMMGG